MRDGRQPHVPEVNCGSCAGAGVKWPEIYAKLVSWKWE